MAKTKKYSLPYWVKAHTRFKSQPETTEFLPAIKTYVEHYGNGGHPELVFTGLPLELANDLYLEWKRRGKDVWAGLFPPPLWVAQEAAKLLNIQAGQTILDVGCGFGNLMWAAQQCGAEKTVGIELQGWVVEWGKALGFDVRQGDFIGSQPHTAWKAVAWSATESRVTAEAVRGDVCQGKNVSSADGLEQHEAGNL